MSKSEATKPVCPECGGTRYLTKTAEIDLIEREWNETCPTCHGTGTIPEKLTSPCGKCITEQLAGCYCERFSQYLADRGVVDKLQAWIKELETQLKEKGK